MTENHAPDIEDRDANIRLTVQNIVSIKQDQMFEDFDRLHKRGIHDRDVIQALTTLGYVDLMDDYAEWAEIDISEDYATTNPAVPDPGTADSYKNMGNS